MHALRLHEPTAAELRNPECEMPDDCRVTLREYYEQQMLPERARTLSKLSISGDRQALAKWEQFGDAHPADWRMDFGRFRLVKREGEPIRNPPIGLITDDDLLRWQRRLQDYGLSNTTINSRHRPLKVMLRHAGPRDSKNQYGRGVLMAIPGVKRLQESKTRPVIPTVDQVDRVMSEVPRLVRESDWWPVETWRALIVFVCCYGFRPGDLGRVSLRNIDRRDPGNMRLKFQPSKTAKKYLDPFDFPLRPEVWQYCEASRAANPDRSGRLFPGLMSSVAYRRPNWNQLVALSDCSHPVKDSEGRIVERFDLYALRRFANVWINGQFEGFPGEWLLGHKFKDRDEINLEHYSDFLTPPDSVQDAMVTAVLPDTFTRFLPL